MSSFDVARLDEVLGEPWPLPKPHVSASQLGMFMRCPEQYRRAYVLGERVRPAAALIVGGAFHVAQETNYGQKVESQDDLPLDEVLDAYSDAFTLRVDEEGGYSEVEWDAKPSDAKDRGAKMTKAYRGVVAPKIQPVSVEREFSIDLPGVPVPIVGYIDVETEPSLIDMKTSNRMVKEIKPEWRLQEMIYQAVSPKQMDWHLITSAVSPTCYTATELPGLGTPYIEGRDKLTAKLVSRITARILHLWNTLGPNEPWDGAVTHPFACNYCGWRPVCHWWEHER